MRSAAGCHRTDVPDSIRRGAASAPGSLGSPESVRNRSRCARCRPIRIADARSSLGITQPSFAGRLQAQLLALFFEPVHLHGQLTDLLMQLRNQLLLVLAGRLRRLEELRKVVTDNPLPLRHLDRVNLVLAGNLPNRFHAHQSFQSDFGFEGTCVSFPFSFTHGSAVVSCSAEPEKSNLATGPNYGVHFCPQVDDLAWRTGAGRVRTGSRRGLPRGDGAGLAERPDARRCQRSEQQYLPHQRLLYRQLQL